MDNDALVVRTRDARGVVTLTLNRPMAFNALSETMLEALQREMAGLQVEWNSPEGGMFLWLRLPEGMNAIELLPLAVERNVAFVPGAAFYASDADPRTLRLSFVTASSAQINTGITALATAIRAYPRST